MPHRTVRSALWLGLVSIALILGACQGEGDSGSSVGPSGTEPSSTSGQLAPTSDQTVGQSPETSQPADPVDAQADPLMLAAALIVGVAVGVAAGHYLLPPRRRRTDAAGHAPADRGLPPPAVASSGPVAEPDDSLVKDLILAHDLAKDEAQRGHLGEMLSTRGVTMVRVGVGDRFDSREHRAVGRDFVATPSGEPTIHAVVRPGWHSNGELIRPPEVVVAVPPQ